MEISEVSTIGGLVCDLIGVIIVASGVWRSERKIRQEFVPGRDRLYLPDQFSLLTTRILWKNYGKSGLSREG